MDSVLPHFSLAASSDSLLAGLAKLDSERSTVKARVVKISHELNIEGKGAANDAILKRRQEGEE